MNKAILILVFLLLAIPVNANVLNDFSVNSPFISGNNIVDHNSFVYSSNTDGVYKIDYGNGKSTYFGFALSGTVSNANFLKFTSDYIWNKSISYSENEINVSLRNNESNWQTNFTFTPYNTKVTNTLYNNLPLDIINAKFYYVFTINTGDVILYNSTNYTIPATPNIHLSGNLTGNIPSVKINTNMLFDFQDIIDNGFTVTDVYLKPASALGINYNGNIIGIGFTKNNGVFPAGYTVVIDPLITNGDFANGTANWTAGANSTFTASNGLGKLTHSAGVGQQLYQSGFALDANSWYRLSFTANSTLGHNLLVDLIKHTSPYTNYGLYQYNIDIGTDFQSFVYEFKTSGFSGTTTDTRFKFFTSGFGSTGESYFFKNVSLDKFFTPNAPVNVSYTQGNFWINYTWERGSGGNYSDSFNITLNNTQINGTNVTYYNSSYNPHEWGNITILAFNNTGTGTLNLTNISQNLQIPNNDVILNNISSSYTVSIGSLLNIYSNHTDMDNDTITYATNANKGNFSSSNGTFSWTPQIGDNGTYNWYINATDGYGSSDIINFTISVDSNTPGIPFNVSYTTGNYWINYTWGIPVNTNSYNISVNGTYTNGSIDTFKNTTLLPHGWSNITIAGFNSSASVLGETYSVNTQIPNNAPTMESSSISTSSITTVQTLTISAFNVTDLDNDSLTVNVSILFNLGGTTNYSMSNTVNTSNWTYSYSSATAGSYTVTGFYITDNYSTTTTNITSYAFTVTTPTVVVQSSITGGNSNSDNLIVLKNNGSLNDILLKIQNISPDLPAELQQLIAKCYTQNILLENSCAQTFIFSDPMNWWPLILGALVGAFLSVFGIAIIFKQVRNLFGETLLYGTISFVLIQVSVMVGINAYFLNYYFASSLPGYMMISTALTAMVVTYLIDSIFRKKRRR